MELRSESLRGAAFGCEAATRMNERERENESGWFKWESWELRERERELFKTDDGGVARGLFLFFFFFSLSLRVKTRNWDFKS